MRSRRLNELTPDTDPAARRPIPSRRPHDPDYIPLFHSPRWPNRPHHLGHIRWDHWWPQQRPISALIALAISAQVQKNALPFSRALYPAVERASDAILALGAALTLAKAQAEAGEAHETQDETAP
jgi:hypothetical protein